jgi:hypothetical protein
MHGQSLRIPNDDLPARRESLLTGMLRGARSRKRLVGTVLFSAMLLLTGCGKTVRNTATEQLILSDSVDRAVRSIDFSPLSGRACYLDTQFVNSPKSTTFVNADYVLSSVRNQLVAAGGILVDSKKDAEVVVEPRVGVLRFRRFRKSRWRERTTRWPPQNSRSSPTTPRRAIRCGSREWRPLEATRVIPGCSESVRFRVVRFTKSQDSPAPKFPCRWLAPKAATIVDKQFHLTRSLFSLARQNRFLIRKTRFSMRAPRRSKRPGSRLLKRPLQPKRSFQLRQPLQPKRPLSKSRSRHENPEFAARPNRPAGNVHLAKTGQGRRYC